MAVDVGDGLTEADTNAILRFRENGGGVLTARDHENLGSCLCGLGSVGLVNQFHDKNVDPSAMRDDQDTPTISWPNYHSGANGDYQPGGAILSAASSSGVTVAKSRTAHGIGQLWWSPSGGGSRTAGRQQFQYADGDAAHFRGFGQAVRRVGSPPRQEVAGIQCDESAPQSAGTLTASPGIAAALPAATPAAHATRIAATTLRNIASVVGAHSVRGTPTGGPGADFRPVGPPSVSTAVSAAGAGPCCSAGR